MPKETIPMKDLKKFKSARDFEKHLESCSECTEDELAIRCEDGLRLQKKMEKAQKARDRRASGEAPKKRLYTDHREEVLCEVQTMTLNGRVCKLQYLGGDFNPGYRFSQSSTTGDLHAFSCMPSETMQELIRMAEEKGWYPVPPTESAHYNPGKRKDIVKMAEAVFDGVPEEKVVEVVASINDRDGWQRSDTGEEHE